MALPTDAASAPAPAAEPSHFVHFYDDPSQLIPEIATFIDSALRAGGTGIVIASASHIAELAPRLSGLGPAQGSNWYPGQLVLLDAERMLEQFMVEGWPDARRFEAVLGSMVEQACLRGGPVHLFGEMVSLLCAEGRHEAAVVLEGMWNELAERLCFTLFCGYPWSAFSQTCHSASFQQVCAAHQHVSASGHGFGRAGRTSATSATLEQRNRALEAEVERLRESERTLLRREKELTDFIENAAEGLHRVGADGTILWANQAELRMLGYRWDEYVGRHIAEFHADQPVIDDILARLQSGETLYDTPARLRCKDGSVKHVLVHSNAFFEDGKLRYTRCFTRDATARHERDQLLADAQAASNAKDEFLAMLGHELRNPLSPIVAALQLMRMRGGERPVREHEIIQRQVDHLVRLVDDLLDVSRVTRGKIDLKIERVELRKPVGKAVEMARPLLDQRRHRFAVDLAPGLSWQGDPVRLAQVISNLLTNAARYTPVGGNVALRAWLDAEGWVVISVKDDGVGLPPEMLARVFDLFVQGQRALDRAEGGLGIGLALVKSIVELHGGTVEARSEGLDQGSEFIVRLPAAPRRDEGVPQASPQQEENSPAKRLRYMVVDDNVDAANTLGELLEALGQEVKVFHEPMAALDAAAGYRPDVALLDIGLPVLDGYQLAARLREQQGQGQGGCRMFALTGYGQDSDRERSTAAGFEQHLVKPVSMEQLLALSAARP